ncbi:hypothetical protein ALP68_101239 [Pseudomonas ficuserectae]|uniref:Uncharacterized protein n=1 Tax=Pseudomonas amygdali pv. mori TaxID=34065 RepID=A0A3M5JJB9_PSEA0|nr:hypothetical protein ALO69_101439 [Pseudomonas ficuserectae]RMR39791.1 hypothetical protein ALP86_101348 [Pseudomonas amygdali pv. mori]RMS38153.1 hypothetical protein ALP68_101239 [Pseudomonas ficuserectae]RMS40294.1 hypothetical protein ALP67_101141 [Pseudomonas ficuserectae]RMT23134.1 hypothetical protein ALP52_101245 [Pseudomonas amygdali pv. mori]
MVVQDVSVGFDGLVCLMCVSNAILNADFAFDAYSLCLTKQWIFNLVVQTDASSVDGYLVREQAPIRPPPFLGSCRAEGLCIGLFSTARATESAAWDVSFSASR